MAWQQVRGMASTYLDFGLIKDGKKIPRDSRQGQEAYDFFMIARYLKDLLSYREGSITNIHHPEDLEDNLKKYCALIACRDSLNAGKDLSNAGNGSPNAGKGSSSAGKNYSNPGKYQPDLTYYEIGSTLMGAIDALEYINNSRLELNIKEITFIGVDISVMMNRVALLIHSGYKVKTFTSKLSLSADLFFAKGSSLLYAFEQEEEFCNVLKSCRLCLFDYSFSILDKAITDVVSTGKPVTFLSKSKCESLLEDRAKKLVLAASPRALKQRENIVSLECIYGDLEVVDRYIAELERKKA